MFKTGSKNSKQTNQKDTITKNIKNNTTFGEYDIPKISGKMADKCFPSKAKNKARVSPIVNSYSEHITSNGNSPMGLNVCFGKKLLRSPSNSQTLEFNDRSREGRDGAGEEGRGGTATCPRSSAQGAARAQNSSVYGRLGNTYGRLQVLGSGIGRIERHLSSSCGNIDHYCAAHIRTPAPIRSAEGNPRFRIENHAVEADRIYQNPDSTTEEADRMVPGPSAVAPGTPGLKGISKGSLQWLMVNRWLPLWVANTGGKNEYKVIDLDFSIYDNVRYPMCTAACMDEHCYSRNMVDTCSLYKRTCFPGGNLSLGREQDILRENAPHHFHTFGIPQENSNSPGSSQRASVNEPLTTEDNPQNSSCYVDCESPEPDSSTACSLGIRDKYFVGQDSVGENDQELSAGDNEQSVSECTMGEASTSSDAGSPSQADSSVSDSSQPPPTSYSETKPSNFTT